MTNFFPFHAPFCSERRQAGKKDYVSSCSKLEEILQQALGISDPIPVPPATIISGLQLIHQECQKRKQVNQFSHNNIIWSPTEH
ncbi:uncharacterized protein VP01_1748g7 [Puccinia sorghi]|uniref:Uncharacterized protein n=1 Tax=Puccinia sorghi TaxID=27349 RepID=A0A0L6VF73_9BASI|nr:uncharacterized protein VP01_1748g7 [Puccinia sorghi]